KSLELLKTIIAFANSRGGSLFIGVSDDAEIVGVSNSLLMSETTSPQATPSSLREAYAERIRRIVSEGIDPLVTPGIQWIEHAGLHILHLRVDQSSAAPHQTVEGGDYYERRGASCKKGLPERFVRRA